MFHRLLLPVDLSDQSSRAVAVAIALLKGSEGTVTLLHVIETIADAEFDEMRDFYRRLETKARTGLESLAEPLVAAGIEVEQQLVYGKRVREIVQFAHDHTVELILMSSRVLDPKSPATAWGSISHQVALLARCPVLLLK